MNEREIGRINAININYGDGYHQVTTALGFEMRGLADDTNSGVLIVKAPGVGHVVLDEDADLIALTVGEFRVGSAVMQAVAHIPESSAVVAEVLATGEINQGDPITVFER